jgi:hypothetical protein
MRSDCDATHVSSEAKVRSDLSDCLPSRSDEINNMGFGKITKSVQIPKFYLADRSKLTFSHSLKQSVSDNINVLRASPNTLSELHSHIRGFLYEIQKGELKGIL